MSQVSEPTDRLRQAEERVKTLEAAVQFAAEWGWCRESREVLMGAVYNDPERVRKAMESSAGIVAEAIQCLDFWEALGEVREAAQELVTQELLRRKGLRGGLNRADWAHLIDRLGRCRCEAEETNAEAFLASIPPEVTP